MDRYENFAVNHYLSEWPLGLTFQGILKALKDDDNSFDITVSETYELYPCEDVAYFIDDMADSLRRTFNE